MRIQGWLGRAGSIRPGSRRFDRRGQALAETAIVLPLILLLLVGIIEMASAWRSYQVVTNAVREGARVAVLPTANRGQVEERMQRTIESGGLRWYSANFDPQCLDADGTVIDDVCGGSGTGTVARIRYETPYDFRLLEPLARLACRGECDANFGRIMIGSTSTMRNE